MNWNLPKKLSNPAANTSHPPLQESFIPPEFSTENIRIFYHAAAMNNWRDVAKDQLALLTSAKLNQFPITYSFVGHPRGLAWLKEQFNGFNATLCRSSNNVRHHETFSMMAIEDWVKNHEDGKVIYFHTKGVSNPKLRKHVWRRVMEKFVLERWYSNLLLLDKYDLVGVNWKDMPPVSHYSGNFWMARVDYLRQLKNFVAHYKHHRCNRFACECWISSGKRRPKLVSLFERNANYVRRYG